MQFYMDKHRSKVSETYEVTFCIGSREGYNGAAFTRHDLLARISTFQYEYTDSMPVKVSDTVTFTMKDYREDGWEVSAITYPNSSADKLAVREFMQQLAQYLLYHFKQNRITIRCLENTMLDEHLLPNTEMLEMLDAEKTHHN